MNRADLLTAVMRIEDALRDAGRDNRHVPQRRMNSRRAHLGTGYLQEAGDGALSRFYFHLKNVQRRCAAEKGIEQALDGVTLDVAGVRRIEKMLKKGVKGG